MYTIKQIRQQLQKFNIPTHYIETILNDLTETSQATVGQHVGDGSNFLDTLVENYQAQIAGFYNDDKTEIERGKRLAVIEEYEDLIAIYKFKSEKKVDINLESEIAEYVGAEGDEYSDREKDVAYKLILGFLYKQRPLTSPDTVSREEVEGINKKCEQYNSGFTGRDRYIKHITPATVSGDEEQALWTIEEIRKEARDILKEYKPNIVKEQKTPNNMFILGAEAALLRNVPIATEWTKEYMGRVGHESNIAPPVIGDEDETIPTNCMKERCLTHPCDGSCKSGLCKESV